MVDAAQGHSTPARKAPTKNLFTNDTFTLSFSAFVFRSPLGNVCAEAKAKRN